MGDSDQAIAEAQNIIQSDEMKRRSTPKKIALVDKIVSSAKKSLAGFARDSVDSVDIEVEYPRASLRKTLSNANANIEEEEGSGSQNESSHEMKISPSSERRPSNEGEGAPKRDSNKSQRTSFPTAPEVGGNNDDDDWDPDNTEAYDMIGGEEEEEDADAMFQVTDLDYDINELAKGLDCLLEE
jgi:hypothetical protein